MTTLSTSDCATFIRDGILPVRAAIPAEVLEPMRDDIWRRLVVRSGRGVVTSPRSMERL